MANSRLKLARSQILSFRRRVGALDERLPMGAKGLQQAAWCGLQDSMPRAALLSIHARVSGASPTTWEHPSFVQLWGPRFNVYVVAAKDLPLFSLARLPEDSRGLTRALDTASRLDAFLGGRKMSFEQAGHALGVPPNSLRYAAPTGRVLLRWEGARRPVIWMVPAPATTPGRARLELARRYLHFFGPTTAASFAQWAGIAPAQAQAAFDALNDALTPVRAPGGDAWILADDEQGFRAPGPSTAPARLLPSGDAYYLIWGADRELLVPDARRRSELWTSRVWPGALLVNGEIAGVWRRAAGTFSIEAWRRFSAREREAVEAEAMLLPLPESNGPLTVRWSGLPA